MNNTHEAEAHSQLPQGFRFHPTDEELVTYYLTKKILDSTFSGRAIAEADLNECEPWDLPAKAKIGEKEWYFFTHRDRKYPTGLRTNRATEAGYWKSTGREREVFSSQSSELIGWKKTLVFYKGRAPKGSKTNWVMHEYRIEGKFSYHHVPKNCKEEWMVCRIFQKSAGGKRSSIELISRNEYRDLPGSPSLPSLLESPCNTTAANNQEPRSSENESVTSAKAHDLFHCSIPVEPRANLAGQHLHQFQSESNSSYLDSSGQLSKMATLMKQSSYMHNLVLKDQRIHMNMIPATASFSLSNMRSDHISAILDQHRGIQQLPCLLSPVPSNSSNLEFSNALVGQSAGSPIEPFSTSCVLNKTLSINNTMGVNNCVHSFQWGNGGLSQKLLDQPIQEVDAGLTGLSTDMNDEMTFDVCNPLDRPLDQLDSYTAPPVDFDSLWNMREVQQDRV